MAPTIEVIGKVPEANGEHGEVELGIKSCIDAISTPLSTDRCSTMVPLTLERTVAQGLGVFSPHFIPMGTLIVTEKAAVVGPKPSSPAHVCLECTVLIENLAELKKCASCGLPLCRDCHSKPSKTLIRHRLECEIFSKVRSDRPEVIAAFLTDHKRLVALVAPLRLLLQSGTEEGLLNLESMEEERKNTLLFHLNEKNVAKVIANVLGLADKYPLQTIHKACGILDTNSFEVQCKGPEFKSAARGLFMSISRINHSCIPNVRHFSTGTEDGDVKLTIKAARDILPGEQILVAYTPPFICTPLRRMILKQTKCFECKCSRCVDPSENGSFLSALKCKSCTEGKLLIKTPFDPESDYACDSCDNQVSGSTCSMMMDTAMKFLGKGQGKDNVDSRPTETIELMDHLSRFVSPSHQLIVDLKLRLIDQVVVQKQPEDEEKVREKLLHTMKETLIQCCKVAPGQSKARAKLSKQYHHLKEKYNFTQEERKDLDLMVLSTDTLELMRDEMERDSSIN